MAGPFCSFSFSLDLLLTFSPAFHTKEEQEVKVVKVEKEKGFVLLHVCCCNRLSRHRWFIKKFLTVLKPARTKVEVPHGVRAFLMGLVTLSADARGIIWGGLIKGDQTGFYNRPILVITNLLSPQHSSLLIHEWTNLFLKAELPWLNLTLSPPNSSSPNTITMWPSGLSFNVSLGKHLDRRGTFHLD